MKILLLSWGIPSKKNPQYGCFPMDQAVALKQAGHDVGILSINSLIGKEWKRPGMHHWNQNGVECFELFGLPIGIAEIFLKKSWATELLKWGAQYAFGKVVKKFGFPDIVHAHYLQLMTAGTAIKEKYPIILVGTEHWSKLAMPSLPKYVIDQGRYAYPMVDSLICVSKGLADSVKRNFGKESVVIHNLFNTDILKPALKETGNKHYTIVAVGSLIERKGFDILIKAIVNSSLAKKNIEVNIYGKGPLREELQKIIDQEGLQNKVFLRGQKNRDEIYEALRYADLFILSSRQETFSVAIIEATGNGTPAVATECGIVNEFDFKDVIKIPTDDIEAMKIGIEKAYNERHNADRISLQQQTIENFSPKAIVNQLEKIYKKVLKNDLK